MENHTIQTPGVAGTGDGETSLIQQAKQQTQQAVRKTQEMAGHVADQTRDQVKSQLASQKERASAGLGDVAEALRFTGEQLRQQNQRTMGEYADTAAQMVERFSGYLQGRNIDEMFWEIENFGRRQPALFLGGAFAVGFLASRFLKSSSQPGNGYSAGFMTGSDQGQMVHTLPTASERAAERAATVTPSPFTDDPMASEAGSGRYEAAAVVDSAAPMLDDDEDLVSDELSGTSRG